MIYLDHAATAPLRAEAKAAMTELLDLFGNPSSLHSAGVAAKAVLEQSRKDMADCLGCLPEELIFTSGGTEANALALRGIRPNGRTKRVASAFEHPSVYKNMPEAILLPVCPNGKVSLAEAEKAIDERTLLVSVQYANNELGTIQPVREIGSLCKNAGACFHTDAVQAVGHIPICLHEEPIDMLSLSAHKFGGPKGIGALYCKAGTKLDPLLLGGTQEFGLRAGTENIFLAAGMAAALKSACRDRDMETKHIRALRNELERLLISLGGITNGTASGLAGHLSIRFPDQDAQALLHTLDLLGFCVSAGAACHAATQIPSRSLLAIGLSEEEAKGSLRISLGKENTREEILAFARAIHDLINKENK